jgi:hypothetical protein
MRLEKLCELRRQRYAEFSVQHFGEKVTEVQQLKISYTWAKIARYVLLYRRKKIRCSY